MDENWLHVGALTGRTFIITQSENLSLWNGHSDDVTCDYESIAAYVSYEDGDMTVYNKHDKQFYIFFSMATKIDLFRIADKILIVDGLFFNGSFTGLQNLQLIEVEKLPHTIAVENGWLNIFDATLHGNEITNSKIEGLHKVYAPHYYSYASVNTAIEKYSAYRIKLFGDLDGETVELFGIELRLFQS
ncbi:MAG TPA: hypothetical protein PLW44_13890 [Chitinophagales bacterium]|nr:hypothetical protein [Chitinophagales bacterium]